MPHDLGEQIPYIRRMLEAMQIPILGNVQAREVLSQASFYSLNDARE